MIKAAGKEDAPSWWLFKIYSGSDFEPDPDSSQASEVHLLNSGKFL
jgi:hypothetical protein